MKHKPTGWVAPVDRYAVPVLFNPYTGEPRDARDIQSDPQGILIVPPGKVEMLAAQAAPKVSQYGSVELQSMILDKLTQAAPKPLKVQTDTAAQLRDCLKSNPEGPHSLSSWQVKTLAELLECGTAQAAPKEPEQINGEVK